ncbi:GGDEF domain-containing protein [Nitratireductor sp. ZSWI3]|uniref:GGDEF domain-containing protein n=1 Tax=Nitratireductor sp. ZSWI3 TaxID=2966359 RepID=UPI00214FDF12|nr:GGDEF domain-containing protein [Nitratireductor sp. ZSWI3]MCR4268613.1 GGDEF domain-containing protein [Nitratireductor sp. ZSWI3]
MQRRPRWIWLAAFALLGTLGAIGLSFTVHYLLFFGDEVNPYRRSLAAALILPVVIAAPLLVYIGYTRDALRRLRRERNFAAAHDPSTEVLNGSTFTTLVERRRAVSLSEAGRTFGALLIVEAGNAKAINLDYGYRWGEESMRQIASVIRANVRRSDVVGRLSDSEFGIFLPGATVEQARDVGERIRAAAAAAPFFAEGETVRLSLDIGGVIFEDQIEFRGLMRIASEQLEMARQGEDGFRLGAVGDADTGERPPER